MKRPKNGILKHEMRPFMMQKHAFWLPKHGLLQWKKQCFTPQFAVFYIISRRRRPCIQTQTAGYQLLTQNTIYAGFSCLKPDS
ncbi:hypothetical protein [uncultured Prevotella sp.]|uniref:hypothetical protein n=1 Tax=uncultured Prevotella sp. TaxID=159272 RepID=UPI00265C99BF|nr:hypothetical protein [uncultured Prevotella sp.]